MEINHLKSAVESLISYWEKENIRFVPKTLEEIEIIFDDFHLKIPKDFIYLYQFVDGMIDGYPNYPDEQGYIFYPLEYAIRDTYEYLKTSKFKNKNKCFIFANYLHRSWLYGVLITDEDTYTIGIIPTREDFIPITNSLSEFIYLYLEDSERMYA